MKIVDVSWAPEGDRYWISCKCGKSFNHSAREGRVRCPKCKRRIALKVLRERRGKEL